MPPASVLKPSPRVHVRPDGQESLTALQTASLNLKSRSSGPPGKAPSGACKIYPHLAQYGSRREQLPRTVTAGCPSWSGSRREECYVSTSESVLLKLIGVISILFWFFGERHKFNRSTFQGTAAARKGGFLNSLHGYVYGRWTNQYINVLIHQFTPRLRAPTAGSGSPTTITARCSRTTRRGHREPEARHPADGPGADDPLPHGAEYRAQGPPTSPSTSALAGMRARIPASRPRCAWWWASPSVDFVLEHNPQSSRRLSPGGGARTAARRARARARAHRLVQGCHAGPLLRHLQLLQVLLRRHRGHDQARRCPCSPPRASSPRWTRSSATAAASAWKTCPFGALSLAGRRRGTSNGRRAWAAAFATGQCPLDAVSLVRDERKGIPLDVTLLAAARSG